MRLHQTIILTSHPLTSETLRKMFSVVQGRGMTELQDSPEPWTGTAFKLNDTVEIENPVSQIEIESHYGMIAP